MTTIMKGKPIADRLQSELTRRVQDNKLENHYVAVVFVGENPASATYVRMKQKFAQAIGLEMKIIGQEKNNITYEEILKEIDFCKQDALCLGMMPQLPLSDDLKEHTMEICNQLPLSKDIDGLSSGFLGAYVNEQINFLGATPQAVFTLLDEYGYGDLEGKNISIVGQSNLLGKPLSLGAMRRGATIHVFNSSSSKEILKQLCLNSDIVISATGVVHLLEEEFFRNDQSQVVIDVGWGKKDGKAVGDIDLDAIHNKVRAYTPIPGGVGPLTIAHLFYNIKNLYNLYH